MDGIFGIGPLELILIAVLALIVLGPERLPGVMREGAKYIRQLRQIGNELTSNFSEEMRALDEINPRRILNDMTNPNQPEAGVAQPAATPAKPQTNGTAASAPPPPKVTTPIPPTAPVSSAAVIAKASGMASAPVAPAPVPAPAQAATESPIAEAAASNYAAQAVPADEEEPVTNTILPPERAASVKSPATIVSNAQDGDGHSGETPESPA